jgi:hypothetical protein
MALKLKLDNDLITEEFFEDTRLLGVMAPVKNYHFVWSVQEYMGYEFTINHDLEVKIMKKKRHYHFSVYEYRAPGSYLMHYLYHNQNDGEFLLPEFKHLDFLWLTKGEEVSQEDILSIQQSLRIIPSVQLVSELTNEKIKNKGHLIF